MMMARSLAAIFVDEFVKHRALAPDLGRVTVTFTIERKNGDVEQCTALLDEHPKVLRGAIVLPGAHVVTMKASESSLKALLAGQKASVDLEGDPEVTSALSVLFRAGQTALSVRLRR